MITLIENYLKNPISKYIKETTTTNNAPMKIEDFKIQKEVEDGPVQQKEEVTPLIGKTVEEPEQTTFQPQKHKYVDHPVIGDHPTNKNPELVINQNPIVQNQENKHAYNQGFQKQMTLQNKENGLAKENVIKRLPTQGERTNFKNDELNPVIYNKDGTTKTLQQHMKEIDEILKQKPTEKKQDQYSQLNPAATDQNAVVFDQNSAAQPYTTSKPKTLNDLNSKSPTTQDQIRYIPMDYQKVVQPLVGNPTYIQNPGYQQFGGDQKQFTNQQNPYNDKYKPSGYEVKQNFKRGLSIVQEAQQKEDDLAMELAQATIVEQSGDNTSFVMAYLFVCCIALIVPIAVVLFRRSIVRTVSNQSFEVENQSEKKSEVPESIEQTIDQSLHVEVS